MNNKKNISKKLKKEFQSWMEKSTYILLDLYSIGGITVVFHEIKDVEKNKNGTIVFRINYSPAYKTANIWFYPYALELYKNKSFEDLKQAITHEIAHILTNPLIDSANERFSTKREVENSGEALTESIAQMAREILNLKKIKLK
jgi:hypothetical protein